jgi:hypothetical protein
MRSEDYETVLDDKYTADFSEITLIDLAQDDSVSYYTSVSAANNMLEKSLEDHQQNSSILVHLDSLSKFPLPN